MSLHSFLRSRGIPPETADRMEMDKIDTDVIVEMSDEDLHEYLPTKGDRIAIKAFARNQRTDTEKRKSSLIESLKSRMKWPRKAKYPPVMDNEDVTGAEKSATSSDKNVPKKGKGKHSVFNLRSNTTFSEKQSESAMKDDRAVVAGFCVYCDSTYRQVRAPTGGGSRYSRVHKCTKKESLLDIIRPLFFPDGKNSYGSVDDFNFDISLDVHGTQLMYTDESIDDVITRLGLKKMRCYLLAMKQNDDSLDSSQSLPDWLGDDKKRENVSSSMTTVSGKCEPGVSSLSCAQESNVAPANNLSGIGCDIALCSNEPQQHLTHNNEVTESQLMVITRDVEVGEADVPDQSGCLTLTLNQSDVHIPSLIQNVAYLPKDAMFIVMPEDTSLESGQGSTCRPEDTSTVVIAEDILARAPGQSDVINFGPLLTPADDEIDFTGSASPSANIPTEFIAEDFLVRTSDQSGVISFGPLTTPDDDELDNTVPLVQEITVHRGSVCQDFMEYFSHEENMPGSHTKFEVKMLKENGTPEVAEDNGGVMRDALSEFWDTFYLQFTQGRTYKVPVLRHDMTYVKWKAVAVIINIGFTQEKFYPIKLAPPFMQQSIFGACQDLDLIACYLKFVSEMDKAVLQNALTDFASVDQDDLLDIMEQHEAKNLINSDNIERIVREIAHKELIQTPMFVADCFHKVLHNSLLAQEDISTMYSTLQPSPRKVLKSLIFPEAMGQDETILISHVKKFVREMDDPEYLGLFLRFCTGSDIMLNNIHVRFISSDVSDNVRCPSSHTCGCVLEIPRSYGNDPYVTLKADFLTLLKNRYWQMDIV